MKLIKNFIYNASYQVFILIVPLLTTPYLSRTIGPEGVGINSYTNSIVQYFVIFGCIGTNLYANRKIAYVRDNRSILSKTFWEIFLLRFLTLIVSFSFFFTFIILYGNKYTLYYCAQSITILGTILDVSWFFIGVENFSVTVIKNFVVKILSIILIFFFVKGYSDLLIYITIVSLSILLGNATMIPSLKKYILKPKLSNLDIFVHLKPSLSLFIPEIATQVYLLLNKTMLGIFISVQASGYYDQSDKIIKVVLAIVTATGTVMLPHVAHAFVNGEKNKVITLLHDSFIFVTSIACPMFLGLAAISYKLVPLFFSAKFSSVSPLMFIESSVILLISWSNVIGTQYLLPTKQNKFYTKSVIYGAFVNIILNIPLILIFGTVGAIISTVISELVVTAYQLYSIRKQTSFSLLFGDWYKYVGAGLIMFVFIIILDNILPNTWVSLIFEVALGMIIYFFLILIFKSNVFKILYKMKNNN